MTQYLVEQLSIIYIFRTLNSLPKTHFLLELLIVNEYPAEITDCIEKIVQISFNINKKDS